ncbi:MAG: hypothetical protein HN417_11250, partial [Desulfobacula sp.]|nr:hypothetical protein [Desulfobacula sp.]
MRKFSSYGPVNKDLHYCVPRKELIERGLIQLIGDNPEEGGHYITTWGPRQSGKTWALNTILNKIKSDKRFDVVKLELEILKDEKN